MSYIFFDEMCREVLKCKHYVEWEHEVDMSDHNGHFISQMICVSCDKVGQSYNIDVYPDDCPHKKALKLYAKEKEIEHKKFLKKCEQEKIWEKLNAVD